MSVGKNILLWGAGLWVMEAASGGLGNGIVSSTAANVASSVNWALTGAAGNVTPFFAGPLAPFATGVWSIWNGSGQYAERGIIWVTEKTALNYGVVWGLATAAGVMAAPWVWTALTVGAGLWAGKHLYRAGKEFVEDPIGNIGSGLAAPFRWTGNVFSSLRGRWAANA